LTKFRLEKDPSFVIIKLSDKDNEFAEEICGNGGKFKSKQDFIDKTISRRIEQDLTIQPSVFEGAIEYLRRKFNEEST